MRFLKALVIGCALLAAGTANAERVFDIDIVTKFSSSGVRETIWVDRGVLTLKDDRTFVMEWSEVVYEGAWLQEKNNLQLWYDNSESNARDDFDWMEQDASEFAGFAVALTSFKNQRIAKFDRAGNLKIRNKQIRTFRPGLRGTGPLKMTWSSKYIGILR
jgi:hypothetical protein